MYFSKITLDRRLATLEQLSELFSQSHPAHALAWQAFSRSQQQDRDFIFREERQRDQLVLYAISKEQPVDWDGALSVKTKAWNPQISQGQVLAFSLRANATISVKKNPEDRRGKKHDVVMHLKHTLREEGEVVEQAELVQRAGLAWIERQGERCGFKVDPERLLVSGYQQHTIRKNPTKMQREKQGLKRSDRWGSQDKHVCFSTLDFDGVLTVTDPARFGEALKSGLGSTKSYGNGLLMIKPLE